MLAVVLSTLLLDYYFAPVGQTLALSVDSRPFILLFSLSALLACWITVQRRRAEDALKGAVKVQFDNAFGALYRNPTSATAIEKFKLELTKLAETEAMVHKILESFDAENGEPT